LVVKLFSGPNIAGFEQALAFTQDKRPAAQPNDGFVSQLKEFAKSDIYAELSEKYAFPK